MINKKAVIPVLQLAVMTMVGAGVFLAPTAHLYGQSATVTVTCPSCDGGGGGADVGGDPGGDTGAGIGTTGGGGGGGDAGEATVEVTANYNDIDAVDTAFDTDMVALTPAVNTTPTKKECFDSYMNGYVEAKGNSFAKFLQANGKLPAGFINAQNTILCDGGVTLTKWQALAIVAMTAAGTSYGNLTQYTISSRPLFNASTAAGPGTLLYWVLAAVNSWHNFDKISESSYNTFLSEVDTLDKQYEPLFKRCNQLSDQGTGGHGGTVSPTQ